MKGFGNLLGSKSWILDGGGVRGLCHCGRALKSPLGILFEAEGC